jgi:acyl-CoA hydrolase
MIHPYSYITAQEAVSLVNSGNRVFVHGSACTPVYLLDELAKQKDRLQNVELVSITLQGKIEIANPGYEGHFHINSFFVSDPMAFRKIF